MTQTPCTWKCSSIVRHRNSQILQLECDCRHGRQFIDEISDQRATRMRTEFSVITGSENLSDCGAAPYLRFFLVRNEEVGGSNPLSSTRF